MTRAKKWPYSVAALQGRDTDRDVHNTIIIRRRRRRVKDCIISLLCWLVLAGVMMGIMWLAASQEPNSYVPSNYEEAYRR